MRKESRQENCTWHSQVAEQDGETGHALHHGRGAAFVRLEGGGGGKVAKTRSGFTPALICSSHRKSTVMK